MVSVPAVDAPADEDLEPFLLDAVARDLGGKVAGDNDDPTAVADDDVAGKHRRAAANRPAGCGRPG